MINSTLVLTSKHLNVSKHLEIIYFLLKIRDKKSFLSKRLKKLQIPEMEIENNLDFDNKSTNKYTKLI